MLVGGGLFFWALVFVFGAKVSKKSKGDTDGSGVKLTAAVKKINKKIAVQFDYHKAAACIA